MDFDRSNKILTLLANFGVVAGLVFLAVEIRQNQVVLEQNQDLMQRQFQVEAVDSHQAISDLSDKVRMLIASDGDLARIWTSDLMRDHLPEVEQARFSALCESKIWNEAVAYRRLKVMGQSGDAELMVKTMDAQKADFPGYQSCWETVADGLIAWGYEDFVSSVIGAESTRVD